MGDLAQNQVRFYRFLGTANQEVRFLVARDGAGHVQVAFDAAESDYKRKLGFRQDGEWLVNNKCETVCRLSEVNAGSSACRPVPLRHQPRGRAVGVGGERRDDRLAVFPVVGEAPVSGASRSESCSAIPSGFDDDV